MNRSFSLLQVAVCALILTGAGLTAMPARAQSDYTFHPYQYQPYQFEPYHYEPYHSDTSRTEPYHYEPYHSDSNDSGSHSDPYHYEPFHSTYEGSSGYHSTYDLPSHSSDSQEGLVPPYHPFTMNPPYAPSSTPNYHFENGPDGNGTIVGPNGPVWHDGLGHVDTGSLQKQGADATIGTPYTPPSLWHPNTSLFEAPEGDRKGQVSVVVPHIKPLVDPEKERERFWDSPPGPYGSVTPIVNPVPPPGN